MKTLLNSIGIILLALFVTTNVLVAQVDKSSELYKTLKSKDSLLFNVGFNTCEIKPFENLTSEDFEFYHDISGVTSSKTDFIASIKNGLCKSKNYQSRRELIKGSLEVFPLKDKGVIYGALQKGVHQFYEKIKDEKETYGSIAKFTHLWIIENDEWKIKRIFSYDHKLNKSYKEETK